MNKTKRVAWHKHLKKGRKQRAKAALARTGRVAASAPAPTASRPASRPIGTAPRPVAPRP